MDKKARPRVVSGSTSRKVTGCGYIYITVNTTDSEIFEIFASLGKAGGCAKAQLEALSRCVTLGLRYGVPVDEYIKQLSNIKCLNPQSIPEDESSVSCADAISRTLQEELDERKKIEAKPKRN